MYPIIKTQVEMVRDRGYNISEADLSILQMDSARFVREYNAILQNTNLYTHFSKFYYSDSKNQLYIAYENPLEVDNKEIDVNRIRNLFSFLLSQNYKSDIIYITGQNLNSAASKEFYKYPLSKNHFTYDMLKYNITHHYSNSKFQILTRSEVFEFLYSNKINDIKKIPYMVDTDPVSLYYGLIPGNVVRITRHTQFYDSMLEESISYRLVVKNPKIDIEKSQKIKSENEKNKIENE
jgi:DNA-directed RNA polymerase subunit H (RpoH/RPB5)